MTPTEIKTALDTMKNEIGPKADITLSINAMDAFEHDSKEPVRLSVYPFGMVQSKGWFAIRSATFDGAISSARIKWTEYSDEHRLQTTKNMALAIIRLTTEVGECFDAALRQEFDAAVIARWGDDACKVADEMAGRGPFRIKRKRGANAA